MTEINENLMAQVEVLQSREQGDHHETCEKILHRCYVIIGILSGVSILLGCFLYDYAQVRVEMKALREAQAKAHRIMWVSENVGKINLKTGSPVSPKGVLGRTIALVKSPLFNWDWPFQHPINPGNTFRDFAEQSDHPFAKELKKHLDRQIKTPMKADDET
tara:strand:+ start:210 stop:692 length:483 start_codon:yes stop_codon:yes gene_type:complete